MGQDKFKPDSSRLDGGREEGQRLLSASGFPSPMVQGTRT